MSGAAATLAYSTTRVLQSTPVSRSRTCGETSTSSIPRIHLKGRRGNGSSRNVTLVSRPQRVSIRRGVLRAAQGSESEKIREVASEKAVESGPVIIEDEKKLANGQNPAVLDAKVEDESDSASYGSEVRDKVVDVASDVAVDGPPDVDALAKKNAGPLADKFGRTIEDTATTLEAKAAEVSEREAKKEGGSDGSSQSFFQDQVITSSSDSGTGAKFAKPPALEELTRTISKNLKDGIDSSRPGLEEISRNVAKGVKAGRENLEYGAEGAVETGAYAREALDGAKGALGKRLQGANWAAEEARQTGNLVANLAAKGWDALSKTTEKFVDKFQKNLGEAQEKAQAKAGQVKQKSEETADRAQSNLKEVKGTVESKTDELKQTAQDKASEAQGKAEAKTADLKNSVGSTAAGSKDSITDAVDEMKDYEHEPGNEQLSTKGSSKSETAYGLKAETDPVSAEKDDEWSGKIN